ncbi:uncharacterized protein MYCFIDRAFT_175560 [Pseudocercospora fijiensis CIRAD86]|uniref:DUF4387 domain-containing protein n=1 Tax=Pseudocercospora fijiensis (strain CIRAD86) TaxID=383855 RepID=M2ZSK1_PSEFD|nr:uncharacterized protein MYCFIDRAFT_175560 [Pseudocercospora fijiensis CIRAD86]EME81994.1 hypothetical protein MYCFIDRAFT_175560 [Pseudocercospora fijiensis CIRAD86]
MHAASFDLGGILAAFRLSQRDAAYRSKREMSDNRGGEAERFRRRPSGRSLKVIWSKDCLLNQFCHHPRSRQASTTTSNRHADLRRLLRLSQRFQVSLLLASAGGDGSDEHVDVFRDIIRELAEEPEHASWDLKVLAIYSAISKALVRERLDAGLISGCGPAVPELTHEIITETPRIVAQMGPEPCLEAMLKVAAKTSRPTQLATKAPQTLIDLAKVVRSKNAGPHELTLDVMFDDMATYQKVKQSGLLSPKVMSEIFKIPEEDIICHHSKIKGRYEVLLGRIYGE